MTRALVPAPAATCLDCDAAPPCTRGLCQRCYNARRSGGLPLPPTQREASFAVGPRCVACRDALRRRHGFCDPCLDHYCPRAARLVARDEVA